MLLVGFSGCYSTWVGKCTGTEGGGGGGKEQITVRDGRIKDCTCDGVQAK